MMDKWLKDPSSVGDASTSGGEVTKFFLIAVPYFQRPGTFLFQVTVNIIENSGEFVAIKV